MLREVQVGSASPTSCGTRKDSLATEEGQLAKFPTSFLACCLSPFESSFRDALNPEGVEGRESFSDHSVRKDPEVLGQVFTWAQACSAAVFGCALKYISSTDKPVSSKEAQ